MEISRSLLHSMVVKKAEEEEESASCCKNPDDWQESLSLRLFLFLHSTEKRERAKRFLNPSNDLLYLEANVFFSACRAFLLFSSFLFCSLSFRSDHYLFRMALSQARRSKRRRKGKIDRPEDETM